MNLPLPRSECLNVTQPANGKVLGNLRGKDAVIRYKCNNGYVTKNGGYAAARCLETGHWNATVECVRGQYV